MNKKKFPNKPKRNKVVDNMNAEKLIEQRLRYAVQDGTTYGMTAAELGILAFDDRPLEEKVEWFKKIKERYNEYSAIINNHNVTLTLKELLDKIDEINSNSGNDKKVNTDELVLIDPKLGRFF